MDREQTAQRQVADVKIMQKVNAAHREAFAEKYENQIEHILRLLCERLQAGLDKRDGVVIADPTTWRMASYELADLAASIYHVHQIRQQFKDV